MNSPLKGVPKALEGYPARQLRVTVGAQLNEKYGIYTGGTTYRGLAALPEDVRDTVIRHAIGHMQTADPATTKTYPLGDGSALLWYEPVTENVYSGPRSLSYPSGDVMRELRIWPMRRAP